MTSDEDFNTLLLRQMSAFMETQKGVNTALAEVLQRNHSFEVEFGKLFRHNHAVTEGMIDIRAELAAIKSDASATKADVSAMKAELRTEFAALKSDLAMFRNEVLQRFSAMNLRFEELENISERHAVLVARVRQEATEHYNEILNAIQLGTVNRADIRSIEDRLSALEARLA